MTNGEQYHIPDYQRSFIDNESVPVSVESRINSQRHNVLLHKYLTEMFLQFHYLKYDIKANHLISLLEM